MKKIHPYLVLIITCAAFSIVLTMATFTYSRSETEVVVWGGATQYLYRGWPLYWRVEAWHLPSPPGLLLRLDYQALNFSLDLAFWATVFLLPSTLYMYHRRSQRAVIKTSN